MIYYRKGKDKEKMDTGSPSTGMLEDSVLLSVELPAFYLKAFHIYFYLLWK